MRVFQRLAFKLLRIAGLLLGSSLAVGAAPVTDLAPPKLTLPFPRVVAVAAAQNLPLVGIDPFETSAELSTGDFVTVLFTLSEGARQQQWLAEFRAVDAMAQESAPAKAGSATIYTSTGEKFMFTSRSVALSLRIFGPCELDSAPAKPIAEKPARILVKSDFLSAGFNRSIETALRLREAKINLPYHLAPSPFPAERTAKDKAVVAAAGVTIEDERAIAATGPALMEFLRLAENTPGLKEIAFKIMDLPPIWAWVTGGDTGFFFEPPTMTRLEGAPWGVAGTTVYRAPFTYWLKGAAAIQGQFYFAPPQPPLLTCAGVVGLEVHSPKHPEKRLELRVLAARRKSTSPPATPTASAGGAGR
jgi:hypothetical protein